MNRQTYLARLAQLLAPLPEQERQDALNYYEEYFDAAGPEAEEATAAELGDPAEAARKILEGEGLTAETAPDTADTTGETGHVPEAGTSSGASDPALAAADANTAPSSRSRVTIPPVVGVLLGIAAVLTVILVASAVLFGIHSSSFSADTATEIAEVAASSAELPQETTADSTAGESSAAAPGDNIPRAIEFSLAGLSAEDAVLDLDYGSLTITVDPGTDAAVLQGENVRPDFFSLDQSGDKPLTVRYKTPANYNLSQDPEPVFTLTVPDTFRFKNLSVSAAMGDLDFTGSEPLTADRVDLELAMGNFSGGTVQADRFTAEVSMGNFNLQLLQGATMIDVQNSMGYIGLTVDGRAEDYTIDLQSAMGEIAFNGREQGSRYTQNTGADRSVTLAAAMGDVVLTTTR